MKRINLISVLLIQIVLGQTRFHTLTTVGGTSDIATVTPASWTNTASKIIYVMQPLRLSGTSANTAVTIDPASSTASTLNYQFVSPPLAKQTIAGNVKAQFRMNVSSSSTTVIQGKMIITVINPAGAIVATLLSGLNTTDLTGVLTNRSFVSTALSSYSCNTGDRIVVEVGYVRLVATNARTGNTANTNNVSTDLAEDNTTTTANNSWIEFSQTILFNQGYKRIR